MKSSLITVTQLCKANHLIEREFLAEPIINLWNSSNCTGGHVYVMPLDISQVMQCWEQNRSWSMLSFYVLKS